MTLRKKQRILEKMERQNKKYFLILLSAFVLSACGQPAFFLPTPPLDVTSVVPATVAQANPETIATTTTSSSSSSSGMDTPTTQRVIVTKTTSCRFGPDKVYVPRYRVGVGTYQIINRDASGQWLHVYPPGLKKSCWIESQFVLMPVAIDRIPVIPFQLEVNNKYKPPESVRSTRSGEQVQISWGDVVLKGKISHKNRFLLYLWLCNAGQLTYILRTTNDLTITVIDQRGCAESSHGQIYTATREGYSQPATIPWP